MSNQLIYLCPDNGMETKNSDSYGTPQWLFDFLDQEYEFDIDLCASDINHKCDSYFTIENNALEKSWSFYGSVGFCNPPYSRGLKEKFLNVARKEMDLGFSTVFVIPADVSNVYWRDLIIPFATKISIITGRVKFNNPHTDIESSGGIGTAIVEFMHGEDPDNQIHWICRDKIKAKFLKKK